MGIAAGCYPGKSCRYTWVGAFVGEILSLSRHGRKDIGSRLAIDLEVSARFDFMGNAASPIANWREQVSLIIQIVTSSDVQTASK